MTRVCDLKPGDMFTARNGTTWRLERNDCGIAWAVRVVTKGEQLEIGADPVADGERDRFSPGAVVKVAS